MPPRQQARHSSTGIRRSSCQCAPARSCGPGARLATAIILAATLLASHATMAYELEPRSYTSLPVGMNFLAMGVVAQSGDVGTDASVPLENAEVDAFTPVVAYARAVDLWGRSGKVDVVAPYSCLEGSADVLERTYTRDVCGLGDPTVKLSVNLVGAPTMTLDELRQYRQDLIFGVGLRIGAPIGEYDSDKLLNPGSNRWTLRPEMGLSKSLGRWTFESILSATFHGDNDDFLGRERRQDPIYAVQGHVIYSIGRAAWIAVDVNGYRGGRTELDGRKGDDLQRNSRWGVTLALPLNRYHSIKLAASRGVITRAGGDFDTVTAVWQYRWGAGL